MAATTFIAAGLLITAAGLRRRAGAMENEPRAWTRLLLGVALVTGSVIAGQVADVLTADRPDLAGLGDVVSSVGCVLACGPFYTGLIHWNRTRLEDIDPGDSVNGVSAVLAMVGLGNLVLPHFHPAHTGLDQWQQQSAIWAFGALFVIFGAAVSIAMMAGLQRDARIWLMSGAWGAALLAELAGLISSQSLRPLITLVWLAAAATIVVCVLMAPRPGSSPSREAASQATIFGALVALLGGVVILVVDNDLAVAGSRLATGYGVATVIGASVRLLRLVQDLSNLAQSRREAMTDELTGIPNRRALLGAIDEALDSGASTSLLIIDLDRFKVINDRYGHEAGDEVLRHMTQAFSEHVPEGGILARLGGDEFAVLLVDAGADVANRVALELAAAAAPLSDVKGRLLQVGASVGVATIEGTGLDGGELLRRADAAMYQAKTSGSGVRRYDSAVDALAQEQLDLVEELNLALGPDGRQEQIVVFFQPQLEAATGRVTGAEALVRWDHPRLGLLTPDVFLHLAEQNELMTALTARVMREAVRQAGRWRAAGHRLRVSVNLSASGLSHPTLLPLIDEVLGIDTEPADLVLEVTETSLMKDPEQALAAMHRIAASGVGISIDDYGTGYSSLSYMNDLPATELKIDRSFTARTTSDPRTAAIVAGTVELAHRLGMRLVAEGVEDEETLATMAGLGCDETQGYLHSRPLPADHFLAWLEAHSLAATGGDQRRRASR